MAKKIILLSFFLISIYCKSQNKNAETVKQLYKELRKTKSDTAQVSVFLRLADYHLSESNKIAKPKSLDSASYYTKKAEKLSNTAFFNAGLGNSYIRFSKIALQRALTDQSETFAKNAVSIFSKSNQKIFLADAYMALLMSKAEERNPAETLAMAEKAAKLYNEEKSKLNYGAAIAKVAEFTANCGKIKNGIDEFKRSISIYESAGKEENASLYSWITILYDAQGDYKSALENGLKAVKQIEQNNIVSQDAVQVYFYIGVVYGHIGEKDKELHYLQKALEISKLYTDYNTTMQIEGIMFQSYKLVNNKKGQLLLMKDMEQTYSKLSQTDKITNIGLLIRAYTWLKEFKKAEKYAQICMAMSDKMSPDDERQEALYSGLTGYLFRTKQYGLARKYANGYLKYNEKYKNPLVDKDMHRVLFRIDSAQGNYESALANYKKEMEISKSLLTTEKNKQLAELQIKYDTEKKDKNLLIKDKDLLLLKKKSELQTSKLYQSNLLKNIAFGSLVFFGIVLLLLYSRYRVKQQLNRILDSQKNEINQKNDVLQKLVTEKEWLLKEIHHRVKNNLQMVISLLSTQSFYLKDKAAMAAIEESQHRINSMSLIHKKLYQSDKVHEINMKIYINELIEYFKSSYNTGKKIEFILDIEPIEMDTVQAVPLGLIVNEAVTNAIKHAFPNHVGTIKISLQLLAENNIKLLIKDNGIGISGNPNHKHFESLGMRIIKGLSDDLEGKLSIENNNGLVITLHFVSHKIPIPEFTPGLKNIGYQA